MSNQPYPPDPRIQQGYQEPLNEAPYGAANDTVRSASGDGMQVQSQRESYVDPAGNQVESHTEVYEDENLRRANLRYWITRIVYFVLAVLEVLLLLRFLFRLLGANQGSSFVLFLYNLTHVFVGPFNGIFNDQALGQSVFEFSTIVAMIVYALIAWGIVSLCRIIFAPKYSGRQTFTTRRRNRLT
ncbi:MAG TPA: YggT family protein [Ktedonobacteraceae bacterium]|nr:YggT family protein [Ktedonobacteraceae bacterium]